MLEPRTLRPVPDLLGSYIRPGYQDHKVLEQLLVEGVHFASGLVIDPTHLDRQRNLIESSQRLGMEAVLDTKSLDLSSQAGFARAGVRGLPWAGQAPHSPRDLSGPRGAFTASQIATTSAEEGVSAVLAPTHFIESIHDPWLLVDADLVFRLRDMLDRQGLKGVPIYYPLMLRTAAITNEETQVGLLQHLSSLPVDAVWLRVHPFGTAGSGPLALQRYMAFCRRLHALKVPLVAEHSGTLGVGLLAFGAVGGIESGVTMNETVNLDGLLKPPRDNKPFARQPRIYLHSLGAFIESDRAAAFFGARGMKGAHGCLDGDCCPRGWRDMQLNPRRHFLRQRGREVTRLSAAPASLRPGQYMENFLRPATDRAVRASEVEPTLMASRRRLESWRGTLGAQLESHSRFTVSAPAAGKRVRRSA